jgi:hypothetical protein
MAVGFVASASSGSQASVASFNISASLGTGARCGIVFVATHGTGDLITGVTWNGVSMTRLYRAADTDTEPGSAASTASPTARSRSSSTLLVSAPSRCRAWRAVPVMPDG